MVQAKPKRRFPWRWAGALATAIVVGVGCAFAVMAPPHTDLPGLKTPSDRRYVFAPLSLPTLAPGQLPPGDLANTGEQHMADIRKLLLPAPQGAVTTDGTETKIYLLQFSNERNAASALIMLGEMAGEPKDAATSLSCSVRPR